MADREILRSVRGMPTSDGAGVRLLRLIGTPALDMLDPFLMLDHFGSDRPGDYIAGFPDHPHRGFETVTYLHAGRVRHRDSAGNEGVIEPGGVQWMTAGRGIVHSEMPEQEQGLLSGFQLWINLPAARKMDEPAYQEFPAEQLAVDDSSPGVRVVVVAGTSAGGMRGPVRQQATDPLYLDIELEAGARYRQPVPPGHAAFVVVVDGDVAVGVFGAGRRAEPGCVAVLGDGDGVTLIGGERGGRVLLCAGRPLGEPVARAGHFVMNTEAELHQAFIDYRSGRLG